MKRSEIIRVILPGIFMFFFMAAIAVGMIGSTMRRRDNKEYQTQQPELFAPDMIDTVLGDESLGQIYVCYNDASYVNVYTYSGEFLWAVSTPYLRNTYFELTDGQLIVYNSSEAYIYESSDGAFVERVSTDETELQYDQHHTATDTFMPGAIYYDTYQVYKAEADGSLTTLVARPWWYWVFNPGICWGVAFSCGIMFLMVIFIYRLINYRKVRKAHAASKTENIIGHPKARFVMKYYRITTAVHCVYAVADVICGIWFGGILGIGIIPITLHLIISSIIFSRMCDRLQLPEEEETVLDFWGFAELGSFVMAFLSIVAASMLAP